MGNSQPGPPTTPSCDQLMNAMVQYNTDAVRALLAAGVDPNSRTRCCGWTPLHLAAHWARNTLVRALLAGGADPNLQTPGGYTALMWAAMSMDLGRVSLTLLAGGADPNVGNGWTPLFLFVRCDNNEVVEALLAVGADPNALVEIGEPHPNLVSVDVSDYPSEMLYLYGYVEVTRTLMLSGADPNSKVNGGWTALMWAARWGYEDRVTKILLNGGALPNFQNDSGWTALFALLEVLHG